MAQMPAKRRMSVYLLSPRIPTGLHPQREPEELGMLSNRGDGLTCSGSKIKNVTACFLVDGCLIKLAVEEQIPYVMSDI